MLIITSLLLNSKHLRNKLQSLTSNNDLPVDQLSNRYHKKGKHVYLEQDLNKANFFIHYKLVIHGMVDVKPLRRINRSFVKCISQQQIQDPLY